MDASDDNGLSHLAQINAQIPRRIRLDGSSIGALSFGFLIFVAGLAVLVWLSLDTAKGLRIQNTLLQRGRSVNGSITLSNVNRGGTHVKYTFTVDNVLYSGDVEMKVDHFNVPGNPRLISVRYLPNDPSINQPLNWKWGSVWDLFPFLLLITITAVGAKVVITALRVTNLARNGLVVVGKVTGCAPKRTLFTVFYVFTSEAKGEVEGSCDLLEKYESGSAIPVIYLPSNPKRNAKYPVPGFNSVL